MTVFFAVARAVTDLFDVVLAFALRTESDMIVARWEMFRFCVLSFRGFDAA